MDALVERLQSVLSRRVLVLEDLESTSTNRWNAIEMPIDEDETGGTNLLNGVCPFALRLSAISIARGVPGVINFRPGVKASIIAERVPASFSIGPSSK